MITLPLQSIAAESTNPSILVIYSPPKMGKTTLLSKLENNLILDFEKGSKFVTALKLQINNLQELAEAGKLIKDNKKPYKYVTVDTVTKLEEWCEAQALINYKRSPMGVNFKGRHILELPNGAGYFWLREAFKSAIDFIYTLADNIILVGHIKDKFVEKKGKEVAAKDLDLTGKIRSITCAKADAIAYMYRDEDDNLIMSFKATDEVTCGSRCNHLKGKEILVASPIYNDLKEVVDINAYWDRIYLP